MSEALGAFAPLVAARGVVQISGYLDMLLASFLAVGAVGALGWAYTLYILPVSLFAMSIAAAELPELARRTGTADVELFSTRILGALRRVGALVVPTTVGYLVFGYLIVGTIYRRGSFGSADNSLVYVILSAYSLGLLATTASRILTNSFYAFGETRQPAKIAVSRVVVSAVVGAALMLWLDRFPVSALPWEESGGSLRLGAVGLALGSALGAWLEVWRLRRALAIRHPELAGAVRLGGGSLRAFSAVALVCLVPSVGVWWVTPELPLALRGVLVVGCYALAYLGVGTRLGLIDPRELVAGGGRRDREDTGGGE